MKGGVWVDVAATCNSHDLDLVDSATRSPRFADPSLRNAKTKKQKKDGMYCSTASSLLGPANLRRLRITSFRRFRSFTTYARPCTSRAWLLQQCT